MADPLRPSGPQIPGSLMGEIQSEVAVEATPLLSFVLRNSRIIVTCIVLLVLVIAGVGGWQWHQTRVEREAHLELGRILVSTQGPERIAALETFLPAAPSAMKSGVQLEIATTALGLEQYGKAADAYAAVAAADDQHICPDSLCSHSLLPFPPYQCANKLILLLFLLCLFFLHVKNLFCDLNFGFLIRWKHNIQNDSKQCCRYDS